MNLLYNIDVAEHRQCGRGRKFFWTLILITIVITALYSMSGCTRHGDRHTSFSSGHGVSGTEDIVRHIDRMLDYIDVSEVQRSEITAIVKQADPIFQRYQLETEELKLKFAETLRADTLDPIISLIN